MNLIETMAMAGLSTKTSAALPVSGYRHLRLIGLLRSTRANQATSSLNIRFNGDAGNNYEWQTLFGVNATAGAFKQGATASFVDFPIPAGTAPAGSAGVFDFLIPMYKGTDFHKSGVGAHSERSAVGANGTPIRSTGGVWFNTAAINTITLVDINGENLAAGSVFDIYGIP